MTIAFGTIIFPVKDVARAKALYTALLGTAPYVDSPYYVGYRIGDQEIGLDPNPGSGHTAATPYADVSDLEASVQALVGAGAVVKQEPKGVGGGMRIAILADADGNLFGLRHGKPA
jgi:predicted enzyme related to lactoylglutathione lyase